MIHISINNGGITISVGGPEPDPLVRDPKADQSSPRRHYVYAHMDEKGVPFYIGKGFRRRAWEKDRHPLWHRYVEKRLQGKYSVVILADDMSAEEAESLESQWIAQEAETLVNWVNAGRKTDFAALDRYHTLRRANRALVDQAKATETTDLPKAVEMYRQAISALRDYVSLVPAEKGIVGDLLHEEIEEFGRYGDLVILDRLTMCLVKLGCAKEAEQETAQYFAEYRADLGLAGAERISKRVSKALSKLGDRQSQ